MTERIRFFKCNVPNCTTVTPFDLNQIKNPVSNKIVCKGCGKKWISTMLPTTCCFVTIKFVSIEIGNRKPLVYIQSFPKG